MEIDDVKKLLADQQKQNAEMLRTVIQELKKPTILEQKTLDAEAQRLKSANDERAANAAGILQQMADVRFQRTVCSHKHASAEGGHRHGVYITEPAPSPGYIHCQKCHVTIRPGIAPSENVDPLGFYDTALFNRIYQDLPTANEMFV